MSYQVLARKWRPRSFGEMVGQEHVLRALMNALDHKRLHHAYLFTGTRGVGKTTVARILAKCLNCETGVGSSPCGVCSTCVEITEGRFVDLIEVDAASRTKVEDTRELLDNVQYSPTSGRYKIYLIDEVHMLSNSSFNALLKTLEEPPEHVKFLLATTDPQKLPATILSRCLQFNLKNMSPEKIVEHLGSILGEEMVPFDEGALWQLARSADGSMRDALSLTDQAIAFGNGKLAEQDVTTMLGTIDHSFIQNIIEALIDMDGAKLLSAVADFSEHAPDYAAALADLLTLLHRIAVAQALPDALDNSYGDRNQILQFATQLAPEDVQLFYQTVLLGQRDLGLCPVPRTGFEMILLRMLAFKPQGLADVPTSVMPVAEHAQEAATNTRPEAVTTDHPAQVLADVETGDSSAKKPLAEASGSSESSATANTALQSVSAGNIGETASDSHKHVDATVKPSFQKTPSAEESPGFKESPEVEESPAVEENPVPALVAAPALAQHNEAQTAAAPQLNQQADFGAFQPQQWILLFQKLPITGVLKMTASNLVCIEKTDNRLVFAQDKNAGGLMNSEHGQHLGEALSDYFGCAIKVDIRVVALDGQQETPAQSRERLKRERQQAALADFKNDPVVRTLVSEFDAVLDENSLKLEEGRA